jgi:hypothetical protein
MNHTKEPWKIVEPNGTGNGFNIVSDNIRPSAWLGLGCLSRDSETFANAHRIVTCVNACTNMKDPETEIAKLRADRAELLEALEELCKNSQGVFSTIERIIGDTDPYIDEDWTEEDVKTEEPLLWACQTLISIEQESKDLIKRMEDKNAR